MSRGLLIVFTGANGSGKTSIINKITERLNDSNIKIKVDGKEVKLWNVFKFPNRSTVLGKKIDNFLKNKINLSKDIELKFFADNRKEFQSEIMGLLSAGYNVICDRYVYCSLSYTLTAQTLSIKNSENINILSIDDILKYDLNLIKPDYVFLILGNHLSLRNEVAEKYHKDGIFHDILLNNYILSFTHTKADFTIIENIFGKLEETVDIIINKIDNISKNRINNKIFNGYINKF
jgi:thymidylate kinase